MCLSWNLHFRLKKLLVLHGIPGLSRDSAETMSGPSFAIHTTCCGATCRHRQEGCMKQTHWALAALMLAGGSATAQVDARAPSLLDAGQSPAIDHRVGTDAWARRIDFASASGMAQPPAWAPLGDVDFGRLPAARLAPDSGDLVSLPPHPAGAALADNIAVENNLVNGLINVQQVPEPSAWLMMLAGLGAIAFVIRRRQAEH
jgi:hypothetical protein